MTAASFVASTDTPGFRQRVGKTRNAVDRKPQCEGDLI
jgi:hypothetical protein